MNNSSDLKNNHQVLNLNNLVVTTIAQGSLNKEEFELLISMTRICSDDVIDALENYAVRGMSAAQAYLFAGISQQAYERAMKRLLLLHRRIETLWEIGYQKRYHPSVISMVKVNN